MSGLLKTQSRHHEKENYPALNSRYIRWPSHSIGQQFRCRCFSEDCSGLQAHNPTKISLVAVVGWGGGFVSHWSNRLSSKSTGMIWGKGTLEIFQTWVESLYKLSIYSHWVWQWLSTFLRYPAGFHRRFRLWAVQFQNQGWSKDMNELSLKIFSSHRMNGHHHSQSSD